MKKLRVFLVETFMWVYGWNRHFNRDSELIFLFGGVVYNAIILDGIYWIVFKYIIPYYFGIFLYNQTIFRIILISLICLWLIWLYFDVVRRKLHKRLIKRSCYQWRSVCVKGFILLFLLPLIFILLISFKDHWLK